MRASFFIMIFKLAVTRDLHSYTQYWGLGVLFWSRTRYWSRGRDSIEFWCRTYMYMTISTVSDSNSRLAVWGVEVDYKSCIIVVLTLFLLTHFAWSPSNNVHAIPGTVVVRMSPSPVAEVKLSCSKAMFSRSTSPTRPLQFHWCTSDFNTRPTHSTRTGIRSTSENTR